MKCSRLPLRTAIHFLPTLATSGPGSLVMVNVVTRGSLRQDDLLREFAFGTKRTCKPH